MRYKMMELLMCSTGPAGVSVTVRTHLCTVRRYGGIGGACMSTPGNQPGSYDAGPSQENPQQYGQQPYSQGHDQPRTPYPAYPGPSGYAPAGGGPLGYLNGA